MHLVIINGSPRIEKKSNTAKIIKAFQKGFEEKGNTSEVWHLSDRKQWTDAEHAYGNNEYILFAFPLFIENLPGILIEFLENLNSNNAIMNGRKKKIAFLVQGGFAEASQLRCCEAYLEKLPGYLNAEYLGTLLKGDMFGVSFMPEETGEKMVSIFEAMGREFANNYMFDKDRVSEFAKPEYFSERFILFFNVVMKRIQRMMFKKVSKGLGCTEPLDKKVYNCTKQNV